MKTFTGCIFIFVFSASLAGAGETFSGTQSFGSDGLLWNYTNQQWTDNDSVNWIHTLSDFESGNSVTTASLPIQRKTKNYGWTHSDSWKNSDNSNGASGQTGVLAQSRSERFDYNSDSKSDFKGSRFSPNGFSRKKKSGSNDHFYVYNNQDDSQNYPSDPGHLGDCYPPTVPPATVPAPGAIILAGIGTVLVGLLRRRKERA